MSLQGLKKQCTLFVIVRQVALKAVVSLITDS